MLRLTVTAIFLSAALLFLVQPMTAKVLVPVLGGSPAVWSTCMVFYQAMLLAGYLYVHLLTTRLPVRAQVWLHAGLLAVALGHIAYVLFGDGSALSVLLDPEARVNPGAGSPVLWLVGTLLLLVGPGFLTVSTTGPLLQKWFAASDDVRARDPYFLYAASNAGSLIGLLAYPLLVEPLLARWAQFLGWGVLFALLVVLVAAAGLRASGGRAVRASRASGASGAEPVTAGRRLRWIALALVPSSLMLGVTQHIATDVASVPLLWVVPLSLYLVSFIWAFSPRLAWRAATWGRVLPFAVLAVTVVMLGTAQHPVGVIAAIHVGAFFVAALMCHGALAEDRPAPSHLTEFYLWLAVGGVLGGIANAIVAPAVFTSVAEYWIALVAACLLSPQVRDAWRAWSVRRRGIEIALGILIGAGLYVLVIGIGAWVAGERFGEWMRENFEFATRARLAVLGGVPAVVLALMLLRRGRLRFSLALACVLAAGGVAAVGPGVLYRERTFFGVHVVQRDALNTRRELRHGTTLHGVQIRTDFELPENYPHPDAAFRRRLLFARGPEALPRDERVRWMHLIPGTYYHPNGPAGDVFREMIESGRFEQIALIGLGTGSLLAYAQPGSMFTIFEIDPAVIRIAREKAYFRFVYDALRDPGVRIAAPPNPGDGRVDIARSPDGTYDLIVIDAFSSDAIPIHLLTRDAVRVYLRTLKPDGVLAFHVSSRHFSLTPVLARIAEDLGLEVRGRLDDVVVGDDAREAKRASDWVVLARHEAALGSLGRNTNWQRLRAGADAPLWTDDYSNILRVLHGLGIPEE